MTDQNVSTALAEELHRIAPDVSLENIDLAGDLRDEFEIDSMDFLTLITALSKRFDLEMPEADYPEMQTFNALTDYLSARKA